MPVDGSLLRQVVVALAAHAKRTAKVERTVMREPMHAPGPGITCAVTFGSFRPARSGLAATSVAVIMMVRLYTPLRKDGPQQDELEPLLMDAASRLCASYVGEFTLDGLVVAVDVRGGEQSGAELGGEGGYIVIDNVQHRVVTITVPLVINDLWSEAP